VGWLGGYRARLCCSQGAPPPFSPRNDGRHHSEPRNWEESGKYVSETFLFFFSISPFSRMCVCVCVCTAQQLASSCDCGSFVRSFVRWVAARRLPPGCVRVPTAPARKMITTATKWKMSGSAEREREKM
jgi:hypothetical protein